MSIIQPSRQQQANQWAMFLHLSQLLGYIVPMLGFAAPIIIWAIKKDEFPEIVPHAKVVLNWNISAILYIFIGIVLLIILIGIPILIAVGLMSLVYTIVGAFKAGNGELWIYPLSINFVK